MKRLVSGIKPTGQLHIGNYLGAIKQFVELQDDYHCFFFIADYHALNIHPSASEMRELCFHITAMLIALGIDPHKSVVFRQSDVSAHSELAVILSNFASVGELKRMTQFKEKSSQDKENGGLFNYPVLMSADIVLYDAQVVPVGDDQIQHLELTREIVRRFNNHYQTDILVEPRPLINRSARVMSLSDPSKKMSKSIVGSAIGLLDSEAEIAKTIRRAVTDSGTTREKSPAIVNLFNILEGFSSRETYLRFEEMLEKGNLHYKELKEQLIEDITSFLKPVQSAYRQLEKDKAILEKTLEQGKLQAQEVANAKLAEIKKIIGLDRLQPRRVNPKYS